MNDERIREAIIEQATEWYLRHRDGDLTAAEKQEFLRWLRASMQHTSEYLAIARLTGGFRDVIANLNLDRTSLVKQSEYGTAESVVAFPPPRVYRSRRVHMRVVWSLASAALLVAASFCWQMRPGLSSLPRIISVAHGEQRTVELQDGSIVHINASSQITVRFSKAEHLVELDRGQAMFEVQHDPTRPFRVRAGAAEATAVGTQFDVYRHDDRDVTVTVVQGKVDVVDGKPSAQTAFAATSRPSIVHLSAGQQAQLGSVARGLTSQPVDLCVATAWVRREVMFEGRPLHSVAQEFNRYIPKPIEIESAALNNLEVSGVFNAYDSDSFIAYLRQYNVEIVEDASTIHIRR